MVKRTYCEHIQKLTEQKTEDLKIPRIIFQIGVVTNHIDILTAINSVEFDETFSQSKQIKY